MKVIPDVTHCKIDFLLCSGVTLALLSTPHLDPALSRGNPRPEYVTIHHFMPFVRKMIAVTSNIIPLYCEGVYPPLYIIDQDTSRNRRVDSIEELALVLKYQGLTTPRIRHALDKACGKLNPIKQAKVPDYDPA